MPWPIKKISWAELVFVNTTILLVTLSFEKLWFNNEIQSKNVVYERIDLIKMEHRLEMIKDLRERTGLDIVRVQIGKIDLLRDVAIVTVFFRADVKEVQWGANMDVDEINYFLIFFLRFYLSFLCSRRRF